MVDWIDVWGLPEDSKFEGHGSLWLWNLQSMEAVDGKVLVVLARVGYQGRGESCVSWRSDNENIDRRRCKHIYVENTI